VNIKIYKDGTVLTSSDLSTLKEGDTVTLAYKPGAAPTKVRFRINSGAWNETTTKNASGEFTWDWTVPAAVTSFSIEGQYFRNSAWH